MSTSQERLHKYHLNINRTKTERFTVPEPLPPPTKPKINLIQWSDLDWTLPSNTEIPTPAWKNMKILGTHIDTETDIKHRKAKAMYALTSNNHIFKSGKISTKLKLKVFECYVSSAFLYNSETWSLTPTQEEQIDAFHRKLLRYALNIRYPKIISNEKLYDITKAQPWSKVIKRRRLNTTGHILRLPENTPIRESLKEASKPSVKHRGGQRNTWLKTIHKDLKPVLSTSTPSEHLTEMTTLAQDRNVWRGVARSVMSN